MKDISILYVDDEENNLTSFYASFRRKYNVFTAQSVKSAKEILKNESIDMVFTDQRMPYATGNDLLEYVRKEYSHIIGVLVTGYTDYSNLVDCINNGNVFKIVHKPFNEEDIDSIIKEKESEILKNRNDILLAELRKKNHELERTEELYRILAKNIPGLVVIILDRDYNYLLADGSAIDFEDFPVSQIEGKNLKDVFPKDEADEMISNYDKSFDTEEPYIMEINRGEKIYHTAFVPIKSSTGLYDRGLVVIFEITHIKKIETELEGKINELKRANGYLDNFVYSVAHDLKSPVANLKSLMDLLGLVTTPSDREEVSEKMHTGISRLDKTLDSLVEIIDMQKNVNRPPDIVDLNNIKDIVEQNISHHIKQVKPIINYEFKVNKIYFSEVYILSIFQNLISNSLKYSSRERPCEINVTVEMIDDEIVLTFEDNGIGIDEHNYDKIYEPFNRLSSQANGQGNGLHIVKSIVDNNNGRIDISSVVGEGTTFKIFVSEY